MPTERAAALALYPFHVPAASSLNQIYYRSKLFTHVATANPILAATNPLFSLLERFSITQSIPPIVMIREALEHEWNAFRSHLASLASLQDCVVVAEYLMSATLDELLSKTYLRLYGEPIEFLAFTPSSEHNPQQNHFFQLVNFMKERPHQYLDLLELAYYCLISGYEGEFHLHPNGRQTLENLIQELYELILSHRVCRPPRLFKAAGTPPWIDPETRSSNIAWKPLLCGIAILTSLYTLSQGLLDYHAKTIAKEYTQHVILEQK